MKSVKSTLLSFLMVISLFSCSKDDKTKQGTNLNPEENFLSTFLSTTQFNEQTKNENSTSGYYNVGIAFKPKKNGTINSIQIKLPQSDGDVVVRIWKVSTKALLKTIPVIVATNNLQVTTAIDKLPLLKDEEYIITMKINSWFERKATNNSVINFPIEINNIVITGSTINVINTYPFINNDISTNYYLGDLSFNFQRTE